MIDPAKVCLFIPPGLSRFKFDLFKRIGRHIKGLGGRRIDGDYAALSGLPDEIIPIVGSSPELRPIIEGWIARGRTRIQWDRGYARRVFATWLPRGANGGYYRWHVNAYQMRRIRDVPGDRWKALLPGNLTDIRKLKVLPWQRPGRHIVVAEPSAVYAASHGIDGWTERTVARLRELTKRKIILREKTCARPLQDDIRDAHCLVTHGSVTAVEAVICGCPVFVDGSSAASLVGLTDLTAIETPIYPDREAWLHSLAYCQYNEAELVNGTLWRLIE